MRRSGKDHWIENRQDLVTAKGKGVLQTYFLTPYVDKAYSAAEGQYSDDVDDDLLWVDCAGQLADKLLKREREIEWVSELFYDNIREIIAHRSTKKGKLAKSFGTKPAYHHRAKNRVPLDEIVDVIKLPAFDSKSTDREIESFEVIIPESVSKLVREYVSIVSFE